MPLYAIAITPLILLATPCHYAIIDIITPHTIIAIIIAATLRHYYIS
jgi:hypothetical protein